MYFLRLVARMPLPVLYALSWPLYLCLYYLSRYRRNVVRENLCNAFPEKSPNERLQIEKAFYLQLVDVALEILHAEHMPVEAFRRRVHLRNPQVINASSAGGKSSVIVVTLHQGNWEWMLHGMRAALGVPIDPVYKPLHGTRADKLILSIRSRFGANPLPLGDAARDILRHRRRFRLLAMVADQAPTQRERALWTQFLNRPAAFHPGPEELARLTGFALVFARCRRLRRGYYEVEFLPLDAATPGQEYPATQQYAQLAEQAIRDEPQSWLWSHRRWKRQPPTDSA